MVFNALCVKSLRRLTVDPQAKTSRRFEAQWQRILSGPDSDGAGRISSRIRFIEAGLDTSSKLLETDIAPYSSLVQRFAGNREGAFEKGRVSGLTFG